MITWQAFLNIMDDNFKYLETEFGFKKVSVEMPLIKYNSQDIELDIFYDIDRHCELDLRIRPKKQIDKLGRSFGIGVIIQFSNLQGKAESYMSPFPTTKEEVKTEVKKLSVLLKKYGLNILQGDLTDLERIQKIRDNSEKNIPS
jgi:hypothetical protein